MSVFEVLVCWCLMSAYARYSAMSRYSETEFFVYALMLLGIIMLGLW
jgi:hypothetical protein